RRFEQSFGDEFADERIALRRVEREVLPQVGGAHPGTLGRQSDHARKGAAGGGPQFHGIEPEIETIGEQRARLHAERSFCDASYDNSITAGDAKGVPTAAWRTVR